MNQSEGNPIETIQVPIHVVGIGLDGATGLTTSAQQLVKQAALLVGSARHLSYFPNHPNQILLTDFSHPLSQIRQSLTTFQTSSPLPHIVILTSGDPLFFGLGRLLLAEFSAEQLSFHPHVSSVQLAFSRIKLPWQDAQLISAHGRSLEELTQALQQGAEKIAVLTDPTNTPGAIAQLLVALDLPSHYALWVCENLGSETERIREFNVEANNLLWEQEFTPLNVVVLHRRETAAPLNLQALPLLGIPDACFLSFRDRPGLMTKREVRVQILSELALQPGQTIWDLGAGTGSVAIEIARLCPDSRVYAIEKTAIGSSLIQQNCQRFQVSNVTSIHSSAPTGLPELPPPDRVFIGGSGGNLTSILEICSQKLSPDGRIVLALATLEHLNTTLTWLANTDWQHQLLQVQLSRSVPIANLTRFSPLNPVTLVKISK